MCWTLDSLPEQVNEDALPPQVSPETAAKVSFIGKAVRVLRPPQGSLLEDQLGTGPVLEQLRTTRGLNGVLFETSIDGIREQAGTCHKAGLPFCITVLPKDALHSLALINEYLKTMVQDG